MTRIDEVFEDAFSAKGEERDLIIVHIVSTFNPRTIAWAGWESFNRRGNSDRITMLHDILCRIEKIVKEEKDKIESLRQ